LLQIGTGHLFEPIHPEERAALVDLNPKMSETDQQNGQNSLEIKTPPIHIGAGPQRISAAFIQRLDGPVDDLIAPLENTLADVNISFGVTALPHMRDMTLLGPSSVTGVSETVSRNRIFSCRPTNWNEEETCAANIIKRLSAQAFRGTVTADDLQDAMEFYQRGRKTGDFENGIRMALQSVLVSPRFLFRAEQAPAQPAATLKVVSAPYRISDQDLASRLSFFLWNSVPDAELIKAANTGGLQRLSSSNGWFAAPARSSYSTSGERPSISNAPFGSTRPLRPSPRQAKGTGLLAVSAGTARTRRSSATGPCVESTPTMDPASFIVSRRFQPSAGELPRIGASTRVVPPNARAAQVPTIRGRDWNAPRRSVMARRRPASKASAGSAASVNSSTSTIGAPLTPRPAPSSSTP
jgi:hypothetical protein